MEKHFASPALKQRLKGYPEKWKNKVPLKVRVLTNITSDLPGDKSMVIAGREYYVWVNSYGAVSAIVGTVEFGLKPGEYQITEWHE